MPVTIPANPPSSEEFVQRLESQRGKPYIFARKGPDAFDCSGLIIWGLQSFGYSGLPGDSDGLFAWCAENGRALDPIASLAVRGSICGHRGKGTSGHVFVNLGNGMTIEAKGRAYGVGNFAAANRGSNIAGMLPGIRYAGQPTGTPAASSGGSSGIAGALGTLTDVFTEIADPDLWKRVGMVAGGAALGIVAASMITGDTIGPLNLGGS